MIHPKFGQHHFRSWGTIINTKEKDSTAPVFVSFYFLTAKQCEQLPHAIATSDELYSQTVSQNKSLLLYDSFVRYLIIALSK